jgi:hypothetical protein
MDVREEQLYEGFSEVTCGRCRTQVLVRKRSEEQTSVQWTSSVTNCPVLSSEAAGEGCPALRESIRAAVEAGVLPTEPG